MTAHVFHVHHPFPCVPVGASISISSALHIFQIRSRTSQLLLLHLYGTLRRRCVSPPFVLRSTSVPLVFIHHAPLQKIPRTLAKARFRRRPYDATRNSPYLFPLPSSSSQSSLHCFIHSPPSPKPTFTFTRFYLKRHWGFR